jgi:ribosomal protein S18 acetylase RimI-like enzyme
VAQGNDRTPPRRRKTGRIGPVVQVRRLHRRDLNKVWEFLKLSFRDVNLETVEYQRPRSKKRFFETYEEEGVEQLLFVVDGDIVAYTECTYEIIGSDTWINPRYFEKRDMRPLFVEELAVHPDWHGRGVGSFVLEQIQHLAKVRGLTHLVLEVAENNTNATLWYRKRGFRKLDAAVFMAYAVDVAPELLPPRALEGEEAGAEDSAILALPGASENGAAASGAKPAGKKKAAQKRPGRRRAVTIKAVEPPPTTPEDAAPDAESAKVEAAIEPRPKPDAKAKPEAVTETVDPSNGQRRVPRPDTAPPAAVAPPANRRRP